MLCGIAGWKITSLIFRKTQFTWKTIVVVVVTNIPLASFSAFLDFSREVVNLNRTAAGGLQWLTVLVAFILPIAIIRRSMPIKLAPCIAMVLTGFIVATILAGGNAFAIRTFLVQAFKIPSSGITHTLVVGDHLLANKLIYRFRAPRRGEPVVFRYPIDPSREFLQRIVAIGGDTLEIRDKNVIVNGRLYANDPGVITESDIQPASQSSRDNIPAMTLPKDVVFVLGDNRDHSLDSRFWGYVPSDHIVGRASIIYWSVDSVTKHVRKDRIGKRIR
jgi:signal peptidase I